MKVRKGRVGNVFYEDHIIGNYYLIQIGKGSLVFGFLDKEKESAKAKEKLDTSKGTEDEDEGASHGGEFVPTAEFAPVIPLPDLIEVKTGEEEETVLFQERAKLLRYELNG